MTPMVADMAEGAMTAFLQNIETFLTESISWMGQVLDKVTESPALTVMVLAMPIAGLKICGSCLNRVKTVKALY